MPLLDDRGRLFGKVNLIDAVVGFFVIILIPVGYAAFLLFRVPVPTIASVQPAQIVEGQETTVQLIGEGFRSFLGARVGGTYVTFLIQDPMHAEIRVPALPVGTYDLLLFDEMQQLMRKPAALTVVPVASPLINLEVMGHFIELEAADVSQFQVGMTFGSSDGETTAEVLAVEQARGDLYPVRVGGTIIPTPSDRVRVPATLRVNCGLRLSPGGDQECWVGRTVMGVSATMRLLRPAGSGQVSFLIDEVRAAQRAPFPIVDLQAVGLFIELAAADVSQLRVGATFGGSDSETTAEVLSVRPAQVDTYPVRVGGRIVPTPRSDRMRVPAILRVSCEVKLSEGGDQECWVGATVMGEGATIMLPRTAGSGPAPFLIRAVRPVDSPVAF